MLTYQIGSGGASGGMNLAKYYLSVDHAAEQPMDKAATYYTEKAHSIATSDRDMHPLIAERLGINPSRPLDVRELANILSLRRADGQNIIDKRMTPNTFLVLTLSAPKSLSIAIEFAPTENEKRILDKAHTDAVASVMKHIADRIGTVSIGNTAGNRASHRESGHIAMIFVEHNMARPTSAIAVGDDTHFAPIGPADMQRHTHVLIPNIAVSASSRATALYQEGLSQSVPEMGAIYSAYLATNLRASGVNVELDSTPNLSVHERMAKLTDIPRGVCDLFSKRHDNGNAAAKKLADDMGINLDDLSPKDKIQWLGRAVNKQRNAKEENGGEHASWVQQAREYGYRHRSVLRPGQEQRLRQAIERLPEAFLASKPMLAEHLTKRHVLDGSVPRVAAAKALITTGIAHANEVNIITRAMRTEGVTQDGHVTKLHWAYDTQKRYARVTTQLSVDMENEAIGLLRAAATDRSAAVPDTIIDRAVAKVIADAADKGQTLDFSTPSGRDQLAFGAKIAQSGMAAVGVGWAGAGKSISLRIPIEAMHMMGRETIGIAVAWRQTEGLKDAGVKSYRGGKPKRTWKPQNDDTLREAGIESVYAVAAFIKRVQDGRLTVGKNTTVVLDEVGLLGTYQMLELARLRSQHGFQLIKIGDDMQCNPVEAGAPIDLCRRAYGTENVPELSYNIRQKQRDAETSALWRSGDAATALARKNEDGTLRIVPGGYNEAIKAAVDLWERLKHENAGVNGYTVGVSVPTNAAGRSFGEEVLERRRRSGEVSHRDLLSLDAADQNGETYRMTIAPGSAVRLFDRVRGRDSAGRSSVAGNNGSVVTVLSHSRHGMTVRKASGKETTIAWNDLRKDNGPIRLGYDVVTIDARQSDTLTDHITLMASGSAGVSGFKMYTADSRFRQTGWIITSQGAEKAEIQQRRPLGDPRNYEIRPDVVNAAVIENMARNLGNQDRKTLATDFMERARGLRSDTMDAGRETWHRPDPVARPAIAPTPEAVATPIATPPMSSPVATPPQSAKTVSPARSQRAPPMLPMSEAEVIAAFGDALRSSGLKLRGDPIMDGRWHSAAVDGDKGRKMSGGYRGYPDSRSAKFIKNFKTDRFERWMTDRPAQPMTAAERREQAAERAAREVARRAAVEQAVARAAARWDRGTPATRHAYLSRKGVAAHGLRQDAKGDLLIPMRDADGTVRSVQTIKPDGTKRFPAGAPKHGLYTVIGEPDISRPILIAEGYATGATLHEVTGLPVIVAFDAGNLAPVAAKIRAQYPDTALVFMADNDEHLRPRLPNIGIEKAQVAADKVGGVVIAPSFGEGEGKASDWNDYATLHGKAALRQALRDGFESKGLVFPEREIVVSQAERDQARATSPSIAQSVAQQVGQQIRQEQNKGHEFGA